MIAPARSAIPEGRLLALIVLFPDLALRLPAHSAHVRSPSCD